MRFTRLIGLLALGTAVVGAGCINPLAARRAQTLKPGEVEVLVIPEIAGIGGNVASLAGVGGNGVTGAVGFPAVTASLRFGIIDQLDLQLKVDPSIIPEISVAYQLVGKEPGDFALSLRAGVKPMIFTAGAATGGWVHLPVGILIDIPLGDDSALFTGISVPPSFLFGVGGGDGAIGVFLEPTVHAGLSLKVGSLVIQPEVAFSQQMFLVDSFGAGNAGLGFIQYAIGVGFGGRFGGPAPAPASPAP